MKPILQVRAVANGFIVEADGAAPSVAQSLDVLAEAVREWAQYQVEVGQVEMPGVLEYEAVRKAAEALLLARSRMSRRPRGEGGAELELAIQGVHAALGGGVLPQSTVTGRQPSEDDEDETSPHPSPSAGAVGEGDLAVPGGPAGDASGGFEGQAMGDRDG